MSETLAVWERVKKRFGFGIKSEAKPKPETVARPMEPGITAALRGEVATPPTGEAAEPLSHGDGSILHGPSARG